MKSMKGMKEMGPKRAHKMRIAIFSKTESIRFNVFAFPE